MGSSSTCFVGNLLRKIAAFRILLPVIFSALPYVAGFWTRRAPSEISTVREFESSPSDRSASTRHWVGCPLSFCPMSWVPQFGCIWPRKDTNFQASCNMLCYHQSVSAKTIIHLFNIWTNSERTLMIGITRRLLSSYALWPMLPCLSSCAEFFQRSVVHG